MMGIPDHLTCLLRNLYAGQEATVRTGNKQQTGSKLGKDYVKAVYCHPTYLTYSRVQFSSVAQLCPTLCDPMNHSMPGLPVHHQLPEFTQTHAHQVGDAIQPSHPLSSSSLPTPNPSQHKGFSSESTLRMRWPKYWSFSFGISPPNEHPGLISFRVDWLDLLAVQGTLKSLLQQHSSKASIFWPSAFFTVQHTCLYDNWKNHSLDQMDLCWQSNVSAF